MTQTVHHFPMRVIDPQGFTHRMVYVNRSIIGTETTVHRAVTGCGQECGTWTVQVGGEPTCEACQRG